ncbi:TetR/AcrR family transcriptional regulator [Roseomonas sp. HJA6]|uniref:TetR/AcrR family transcriptional regulator n=1 Tax=Roseomonas alba TaxID=2846776 RepID=A0ABS7AA85_9PROT|nr:TetR/AcrR family transcriptional regulator [Neoroseomonas alba]MBW6399000.1 TetR/AcrR family transcriptional regulator [Neoroseomonas alba]
MTPPARRRKETRPAEVLDAALDTFRARGFAATRMEDIAARAGISKGTIYLYFPSKEAVFEALVRANIVPVIERLQVAMAEATGPATDRLRLLARTFAMVSADPRLVAIPRLVLAEAGNFPDMARFYRQEVVGRGLTLVTGILEHGVQAGEFRTLDAALAARLFLAPMVLGALWRATFAPIEDSPLPTEDLLALHLDLFLRAIAAESPP